MSKESIDNEMDESYEYIKNGEYAMAVEILKTLRIRFPDQLRFNGNDINLEDVKKWEQDHDSVLELRIKEIEDSESHPFDKQKKTIKQLYEYAISYFRYYDGLRRENEIY